MHVPKHIHLPSIRYMFKPRQLSITGRSKKVLLLLLRVIDDSLELYFSSPFESADDNWASSWENGNFAYAKTKTQISFAVTAKLISAFVFAT